MPWMPRSSGAPRGGNITHVMFSGAREARRHGACDGCPHVPRCTHRAAGPRRITAGYATCLAERLPAGRRDTAWSSTASIAAVDAERRGEARRGACGGGPRVDFARAVTGAAVRLLGLAAGAVLVVFGG